uniref:NAD(P)-dependent dehydrogenase, short-chain alcohol dehydrogenase family n=1 Tax=Candidatus Kentrum sp. TUN TaxID=2126343 RepID=A0A450ZFV5_9GAMM|nr:MAG: NAD(P)-dependent dehydrogenase, short-chain alcohol dehydrogenase family [Candidatus Kentron sp. TUN]VFK52963.1 MAG: NAD(P)-dependent dehydrogenase, short-chain alcohol dehydrogenase family [Candidatus Kentron sp. TUN]VFK53513.1 MAG: NAD(P)-dependent dehydrogenase, short-chain alcohol dehydrogenase family [Candidatus Kentron sp. TUN]
MMKSVENIKAFQAHKTLEGCRVIVTGAATGIGRTTAERFLTAGAKVYICDIDQSALDAAREALPGLGMGICDVSDPGQVERFFSDAVAWLGGLDILINNAGVSGPTAPVEDIAPEDWTNTLAVGLTGQFLCAHWAVPPLKAAGGGSIVNVSSAGGVFGYPMRTPYAASKWGVIGFTKTLAMELGPFSINVNAICPGFVAGERLDRVIATKAKRQGVPVETLRETYLGLNSMHKFIEPAYIAETILFLCSSAGAAISGQTIGVDGDLQTLRV